MKHMITQQPKLFRQIECVWLVPNFCFLSVLSGAQVALMLVLQFIQVPRRHKQLKYNPCFTSFVTSTLLCFFWALLCLLKMFILHLRIAPLWYAAGFWEFSSSCGGKAPVKSKKTCVSVPPFSGSIFTHANILTH